MTQPVSLSSWLLRLSHMMVLITIIFFFFLEQYTAKALENNSSSTKTPVNIGVILDANNEFGKVALTCINMALSDFYSKHSHYQTRLVLNVRDSKGDVVGAVSAAVDLIKNKQVEAVIVPDTSTQSNFIINLGNKSHVPIISFSATSPSLTSIRTPFFFRVTTDASSQVDAIASVIHTFSFRQAIPICIDDDYGRSIIPYLANSLLNISCHVPYRSIISPVASDDQILKELYKLLTMQTRVFIVHMSPLLGSRLLVKAREIGMMEKGFVWILTDGLGNFLELFDRKVIGSLQGVIGVRIYLNNTDEVEKFRSRVKEKFQEENPGSGEAKLSVYGLFAYDSALALAMAIENSSVEDLGFDMSSVSNRSNKTDFDSIGVSRNGANIVKALSNSPFRGLSGEYRFVDRQLQTSGFEIVNLNGNSAREIGLWVPEIGLTKKFENPSTDHMLGSIIWPGDSTVVPRGWEIPTNERKLRVGVPVKDGFNDFVDVKFDNGPHKGNVTGYCIDVFDAVMRSLPYAVSYDYIPFGLPNGSTNGTYDELTYQIYLGKLDAVVGDITIRANRSKFVEFTLPFTESGVTMIVPIKDRAKNKAWVFMKPLTSRLWITSACFFVFIGFVVWVLEHRINEDFRGPAEHQVGTSFWFSFSTMVFSQRERVISNLSRFVVIVWCFVVLILVQSYTASLTSYITVQQLQPTITDIHELIRRGDNVAYQKDTYVIEILTQLGFDESKLLTYSSAEECDELFQKGSTNGGISAAFDEVPYMKLFISQYCSKYTMTEPTFKTAGFGFAFPLQSPLIPDVSRAILSVTESNRLKQIEAAYFNKHASCPDLGTPVSSDSLGLDSFWGLFLIAGIAAILALIIFAIIFVYKHRNVLKESVPRTSLRTRIQELWAIFISKDLNSHTFRDKTETGANQYPATPSSYTDFMLSPSTVNGDIDLNPSTIQLTEHAVNLSTMHPTENSVQAEP